MDLTDILVNSFIHHLIIIVLSEKYKPSWDQRQLCPWAAAQTYIRQSHNHSAAVWFFSLLFVFVGCLLNFPPTCDRYFRDRSALTIIPVAILKQEYLIKFAVSPSHIIPTTTQTILILSLNHQAHGRMASTVPVAKSLVWFDQGQHGLIPGSPTLEVDAIPQGFHLK